MITPRIKPSGFFPEEAPDDMFLMRHRKAKLEGYVQTLAAMDELIDFSEMALAVDVACPRADRSKGGRPPYPTEAPHGKPLWPSAAPVWLPAVEIVP